MSVIDDIDAEIDKLYAKKKRIQDKCSHPDKTSVNKGSSGNWDRDDSYWVEHTCNLCGKYWATP